MVRVRIDKYVEDDRSAAIKHRLSSRLGFVDRVFKSLLVEAACLAF
jgi:hypothetical protein